MARNNRTQFALLGMLCRKSRRSGYDLKKEFEERMQHFWSESIGQIYPTLRRLEADGLVTSRTQAQRGRPDRILYSITKAGRERFREWMPEPAKPPAVRNELLLKLFFGPQMDLETAQQHLRAHRDSFAFALERYKGFRNQIAELASNEEEELYWLLTLRSGEYVAEARKAWAEEALQVLHDYRENKESRTTASQAKREGDPPEPSRKQAIRRGDDR